MRLRRGGKWYEVRLTPPPTLDDWFGTILEMFRMEKNVPSN